MWVILRRHRVILLTTIILILAVVVAIIIAIVVTAVKVIVAAITQGLGDIADDARDFFDLAQGLVEAITMLVVAAIAWLVELGLDWRAYQKRA